MSRHEPIGLLIAAVRRRLKQSVSTLSGDIGVSPQQFWTIVGIAEHEGLSLGELAAQRYMDQPTACRIVASLTRRRLLRSRRDPADRRRTLLELTASGRELALRCLPVAERVRTAVEGALEPAECEALATGLQKIITNLERLDAGIAPVSPGRLTRVE